MKRGEGVSREETDRILREVDRQLRGLTAAAAERVLRTAAPGLGEGMSAWELRRYWGMRVNRSGEFDGDLVVGCSEPECACRELAENWEELDGEGENLEWVYRRGGRWRVLEGPGWDRSRPRRAWQYDYWRIEDARSGDGAGGDHPGVPDAVDG